jgi:DNA-binding MarR family transcriptional regulator
MFDYVNYFNIFMSRPHIPTKFYYAFLECLVDAKRHIVAIGAEFGLTSIQAITLLLLDENHPRPMKSFCTVFHCDASNVTGIIDGLEERSLVERQNDPKDRRVKVIRITPAGKRMQEQIIKRLDAENGFMFDPLTDTEATQLVHIIEKLAQAKSQL